MSISGCSGILFFESLCFNEDDATKSWDQSNANPSKVVNVLPSASSPSTVISYTQHIMSMSTFTTIHIIPLCNRQLFSVL